MKDGWTFLEPYCWDQRFLKDIQDGLVWKPVGGAFDSSESQIFVVPGAYWTPEQVNVKIAEYKQVIVMITSDEENLFDYKKLKHPKMKVWVQTPRANKKYKGVRLFGVGYGDTVDDAPSEFIDKKFSMERPLDVFVSAQDTHVRRHEMFAELEKLDDKIPRSVNKTEGFTKGLLPITYHTLMAGAKIAPAPSGVVSPDSFRFYEALEHGCIPIADDISPSYNSEGYWLKLYPDSNFPILKTYESLLGYIDDLLDDWVPKSNRIFSWWQKYKRQFVYNLQDDLIALGATHKPSGNAINRVTAIIPSSPIGSHPDTAMLEEVIDSIRHHLPSSEIIITFDGVREEQEHYRERYEEYIRRILWKANNEWENVLPVIFDEHHHQASMLREVLPMVKTPSILYMEQDAPLVTDYGIDWPGVFAAIESGDANLIRFMHESNVHPEHQHLSVGEPELVHGIRMQKTLQWSQRPHVASVAFYQNVLDSYFHPDSKTMIEDVMHGRVQQYGKDAMGWAVFRLWLYLPEGNAKRSYHLDGRNGDPKYEMDIKDVAS